MFCLKHVISYLHICDYLYRTVTLNREMVVSGYLRVFGLLIGTFFYGKMRIGILVSVPNLWWGLWVIGIKEMSYADSKLMAWAGI